MSLYKIDYITTYKTDYITATIIKGLLHGAQPFSLTLHIYYLILIIIRIISERLVLTHDHTAGIRSEFKPGPSRPQMSITLKLQVFFQERSWAACLTVARQREPFCLAKGEEMRSHGFASQGAGFPSQCSQRLKNQNGQSGVRRAWGKGCAVRSQIPHPPPRRGL